MVRADETKFHYDGKFSDMTDDTEQVFNKGATVEQSFNSQILTGGEKVALTTVHEPRETDDTHAAAKASLQNAAPDAADTLAKLSRGEVKGSAAELRVRLDAAKGVLDRVGLGPNTAAPAAGDASKLTREQMHDLLQRLVTEQGDRALPVTIDAQQDVSDLFD